MKSKRKDKNWLKNPDQMKNEKLFSVKMFRDKNGTFHVVGGETKFLSRKNQNSAEWVNVDTRDFASVLRNSSIKAR